MKEGRAVSPCSQVPENVSRGKMRAEFSFPRETSRTPHEFPGEKNARSVSRFSGKPFLAYPRMPSRVQHSQETSMRCPLRIGRGIVLPIRLCEFPGETLIATRPFPGETPRTGGEFPGEKSIRPCVPRRKRIASYRNWRCGLRYLERKSSCPSQAFRSSIDVIHPAKPVRFTGRREAC